MGVCFLERAIIAITGEEADVFLNRLLTNDTLVMSPMDARYAALLSPQGKILFEFLVVRTEHGFWLDCARDRVSDLAQKLTMFRLRAKVTIKLEKDLCVAAAWDIAPDDLPGRVFRDPRHDALGFRIIARREELDACQGGDEAYDAHRITLGIPKEGVDFVYGDSFVHEANLDLLHAVDFEKGCYVGQEVVSRVHHRKSARKRVVKLHFHGNPPSPGAPLVAGGSQIGEVTSTTRQEGLAIARLDRLDEAEANRIPVLAGETLVEIIRPDRDPTTSSHASTNV